MQGSRPAERRGQVQVRVSGRGGQDLTERTEANLHMFNFTPRLIAFRLFCKQCAFMLVYSGAIFYHHLSSFWPSSDLLHSPQKKNIRCFKFRIFYSFFFLYSIFMQG